MKTTPNDSKATATAHTPGPWKVTEWTYQQGKEARCMIEAANDAVATVTDLWCMDDRAAEREANARLIASAPDLLHALELLLPWAKTYIETQRTPLHGKGEFQRIEIARAAIARAKGEA